MTARSILGCLLVSLCSLASACSQATEVQPSLRPRPKYESGTRLKARVLDLKEADVLVSWWDSREEIPCRFRVATDGELRCLPIPRSDVFDPGVDPKPCAAWPEGAEYITDTGGAAESIVRNSDEAARARCTGKPIGQVYERTNDGDGECLRVGEVRVRVVAPDRFVRATRKTVPVTAQYAIDVFEAEDGARHPASVRDRDRDETCELTVDTYVSLAELPPELACVPGPLLSDSRFTDDACTQEVPVVRDPRCAPFVHVISESTPRSSEPSYRQAIRADSGDLYGKVDYSSDTTERFECEPVPQEVLHEFVAFKPGSLVELNRLRMAPVGTPVAVWGMLDEQELLSIASLEEVVPRSWDQSPFAEDRAVTLFGRRGEQSCRFVRRGNEWVCTTLPTLEELESPAFADAACETPLAVPTAVQVSEGAELVWVRANGDASYARIGPAVEGQTIYHRNSEGQCEVSPAQRTTHAVEILLWKEPGLKVVER